MMPEISMNILDVAENSVRAKASLITITVDIQKSKDSLTVIIEDNGCGMSAEQLEAVLDPFYTTRTTRKIGLGVPFFKLAAVSSGGEFDITSQPGIGTRVTAVFGLTNINRMPLGDISSTIYTLVTFNTDIDFVYTYRYNEKEYTLDTREFKAVLGDVPLDAPEVSQFIKSYLTENKLDTDGGVSI